MAYRFFADEPIQAAVKRVASEQIAMAIRDFESEQMDRHEAVHRFRKRCKKMRGLLRLVRPHLSAVYQAENYFYRDLSRKLSFVRDAQALVECVDRLRSRFPDEWQSANIDSAREPLGRIEAKDGRTRG